MRVAGVSARKKKKLHTAVAGRRSNVDRAGGRWRISVREVIESRDGYSYTTYLVQGWKEDGKWKRRRFKDRAEAEAFMSAKRLENPQEGKRMGSVVTSLSHELVTDAENAAAILAALSLPTRPTLTEAATHYAAHLRKTVAVEAVPLRDARKACLADKEARGVLRARSAMQLESSLRLFENWLLLLPRYQGPSIDEHWSPPVSDVTGEDVTAYLESLRGRGGLPAAVKTRRNVHTDLQNFFNWCLGTENDKPLSTKRRWHFLNPTAGVTARKPEQGSPDVLSLTQAVELMEAVESFQAGALVPYFALALFAGIRPGPDGELRKLAVHAHRDKPCREAGGRPLIDLERGVITITADIAKTRRKRVLTVQPNLDRWLKAYGVEILPDRHRAGIDKIRKKFALGHDVLRHSFISYHVAAFRSKGDTALQAGTSEAIIDAHYLNLPTQPEGVAFFGIVPLGGLPSGIERREGH